MVVNQSLYLSLKYECIFKTLDDSKSEETERKEKLPEKVGLLEFDECNPISKSRQLQFQRLPVQAPLGRPDF